MAANGLSNLIPAVEGSKVLAQGLRELRHSGSGPLSLVTGMTCALGAIYFGARITRADFQTGPQRPLRKTTPHEPPSQLATDLLGLTVSMAGFASATRLAHQFGARRR